VVLRVSGGVRVFVDQAVEDRFSADPFDAGVGCGNEGNMAFAVGDTLRDALVRTSRVVMRLGSGQDGAQMRLTENQHAVEDLSAQSADEPLADRVHPRRQDSGAQDPGTGGLEDGVEGSSEVRSAVTDQELNVLEPLAEAESEVAGLLHRPLASGVCGDPADVHPAGAMFDEHQDSVESGLSLLSVFVLPRTDDRQMTLSLGQTQSSNEEEGGARKRSVCPLSEVAGSRSVA